MADTSHTDAKISQEIFDYLTDGSDWSIPEIDLNSDAFSIPPELLEAIKQRPDKLTNDSLTNTKFTEDVREYGKIQGTGTFDVLLESIKANLWAEYHKGRITGAEYSQAFVTLVQGAMQNSVQFLLSKDKAYWEAMAAQIQAVIAAIDLQTKKMQYLLTKFQAYLYKAQYSTEKMKLSTMDKQYESAVLSDTLNRNKDSRETNLTNKQIELMTQQIVSYKRRDEREIIKLQTDTWSVSKGIAEDTPVPEPLANPAIVTSINRALSNVGLK